jgi:thioredoxin 1
MNIYLLKGARMTYIRRITLLSSVSLMLFNLSATIKEVRNCAELDSLLNNPSKPSLFYIHASWCGPCQSMSPIIAETDKKFANRLDVYSVDYDNFKEACAALGVDGLPRMIFARQGERIVQKGARQKENFLRDAGLFVENKLQPEREVTTPVKAPAKKAETKK